MCGICGVWEYGAASERVERSLVERMRDEMPHRGPDDAGSLLFDGGRGGLGFRRLSIIDLSEAGHQPMHGCTDEVWLVWCIGNHGVYRDGNPLFSRLRFADRWVTCAEILHGSRSKKIQRNAYDGLPAYGTSSHMRRQDILARVDELIEEGALATTSGPYPVLQPGAAAA